MSLVELLVALAVASVALTAAWPSLWNVAAQARAQERRAQAATAGAYALRSLKEEVAQATTLASPPAGLAPQRALCLRHRHQGQPVESVVVAWDASREVLWRKTSSTYLCDQVTSFIVTYVDAQGGAIDPSSSGEEWPSTVAIVRIALTVGESPSSTLLVADMTVGPR